MRFIQKYKDLPIPVKATIWLSGSSILLKGVSFFTSPMFARILPLAENGKSMIFSTYESLFIIFATWSLALGPYQKGLFKYKDRVKEFTTSTILLSNIITLLFFTLVVCFYRQVIAFTEMSAGVLIVLFIYLLLEPAYQCWSTRKHVAFDYKKITCVAPTLTLAGILCSLTAVSMIAKTAGVKFVFMLLPSIFAFAILYFKDAGFVGVLRRPEETREHFKFLITFGAPLVIHSLSFLVLGQSDKVMISKLVGNEQAGIYGIAVTIANIAVIIQSAANQVISPWIFHCMEEKKYQNIRKNSTVMVLALAIMYVLFTLAAPEVIILLYPKEYHAGIWCIPPIAIGVFFTFMYNLFVCIESYLENTKYIALVSTVCAGLNIVLNYVGIRVFGYTACAYTTLICYVFFAFGHYHFMKKLLNSKCNGIIIYSGPWMLAIGIFVIVCMVGATILYPYPLIRYGILLCSFILMIIYRKKIFDLLSNARFGGRNQGGR